MITTDFYEDVLIKPVREGADSLKIISGYATSAMAFHHLEELAKNDLSAKISLLVGMCPADGISVSNHKGFQSIVSSSYSESFSCSYIFKAPPVHSKLYIWTKQGSLFKSFIGSANYTQNAFSKKQREIIAQISDSNVLDYFDSLEADSIFCNHQDTDSLISIYNDRNYFRRARLEESTQDEKVVLADSSEVENVTISLLSSRTGDVQNTGGLNWGQRPGRNPNQAYIQLPPKVYRSDFFPIRGTHFTVVTDDSKTFICTRAQKDADGQAIETPHNNALLGEYFRNRMGLSNGQYINKDLLARYGRTDVTFYKFDDENYYMDFSVT